MTDKPILFSTPMVRALLDGRKTMTRRVLKPRKKVNRDFLTFSDGYILDEGNAGWLADCHGYAPGDRLWVREAWTQDGVSDGFTAYRADGEAPSHLKPKWRSPIHMPRALSRLTLIIESVKVERVQDISASDSIAEGVECETCAAMRSSACSRRGCFASLEAFRHLWNSIHGPDAWDANPWVVAITFRVIRANIYSVEASQ